jgi:putative acetyltransferase
VGLIEIRPERESDHAAIRAVTEAAFAGRPYADGDEQDVIDRLRAAGALSLSLVASSDGPVVGQVSFSPASLDGRAAPWCALGPVSVAPHRQREGIGSRLIEAGLAEMQRRSAHGCILVGDPAYYARFGFAPAPAHCPDREPATNFMLKLLGTTRPEGRFAFHGAFYA